MFRGASMGYRVYVLQNPLLGALNLIHLVNEACEFVQDREKTYLKGTKACDSLVRKLPPSTRPIANEV